MAYPHERSERERVAVRSHPKDSRPRDLVFHNAHGGAVSTTSITRPRPGEPGLSRASLDRLRALLWTARKHEVAEMLACWDADREPACEARLSGLLERDLAVDAGRRAIADIDHALARLEAGTYGACEQCGSMISFERLASVPQTRSCGRCRPGRVGFWGEKAPSP